MLEVEPSTVEERLLVEPSVAAYERLLKVESNTAEGLQVVVSGTAGERLQEVESNTAEELLLGTELHAVKLRTAKKRLQEWQSTYTADEACKLISGGCAHTSLQTWSTVSALS